MHGINTLGTLKMEEGAPLPTACVPAAPWQYQEEKETEDIGSRKAAHSLKPDSVRTRAPPALPRRGPS